MEEIKVYVEVEVNPTESEDKVKRAVRNFFGDIPIRTKKLNKVKILVAEDEGEEVLNKLYDLLRKEKICNAARGILFGGLNGKNIRFRLNKQAAYVGRVSFSKGTKESPLGPIKVRIECDNPREVINWMSPKKT